MVVMFIIFGADTSARNEEGKSPVDFAIDGGRLALSKRLEFLSK
jgi:hypothetical protein